MGVTMFTHILKKEIREIIGSTRFTITFAVCAVLIVLTFYIGAREYQLARAQYEAATSGNLRQMEGLTEWMRVEHHIFLPPQPLATLVSGISNDIGRNIEVFGMGELSAESSRFGDEPIFAVFRFLDLDFIFQIVLSLFAILFAYGAINGEKEQGTLRLSFANAIPRDTYILGKIAGVLAALALPLMLPILIGCLLLILMGIPLSGGDWLRLALVIAAGMLYFSIFLTLSVWISTLTHRSTSSFLLLLTIWLLSVMIIPRSAVLLAGRAVAVLSIDEMAAQKSHLRAQLWREDQVKMKDFRPDQMEDMQAAMTQFNQFMQDLSRERDEQLRRLGTRLNEQRRNEQRRQERLALWLARISPSAAFSLAAMNLAGSSTALKQHYLDEAHAYQAAYASFLSEKTGGLLSGSGLQVIMRRSGDNDKPAPIDPREIPPFQYRPPAVADVFNRALPDLGLLLLFNMIFFAAAYVSFMKYDVR